MFITIGYLILYFYEKYKALGQQGMGVAQTLGRHLRNASVVFRSTRLGIPKEYSPLVQQGGSPSHENVLFSRNDKQVFVVSPKMKVNLDGWVSYLGHTGAEPADISEDKKVFVLLETVYPEDEEDFLERSFSIPQSKRIKVVECVSPIAWKSGNPFGIVAECDEGRLNSLCSAFIEGRLVLDDLLELNQIITVDVEGKATNLLNMQTAVNSSTPKKRPTSVDTAWDSMLDELHSSHADLGSNCLDSNESLASGIDSTIRDFLASEQSLDDLESGENLEKSEDDVAEEMAEKEESDLLDGGESLSGPVEDLAPETLTPIRRRTIAQSKPPNILVYCGKKDSQRQFEAVRNTLQQCINIHRYVIYNLKHNEILSTPWADNTALLIIASEKAYDGVDQAFLEYFLNGGLVVSFGSAFDDLFTDKVLISGSASVMPLSYKNLENVTVICTRHQYSKDVVSKLDNVSLRVVSVDKGRGNPVILEANHDVTNAAAILTQVNLDKDATEMAISPEIFAALKQANPNRCAILRDMLSSLGLDTENAAVGKLAPASLFATSEDRKDKFIQIIDKRCKDNILRSRSITLEFVRGKDNIIPEPKEDRVPLILTPNISNADPKFDFKAYKTFLTSKHFGHTVIYSDVIPSTMPVLDCLMMSMSEDQGLVVVARQQVSGLGRGGNAWLSPDGCLCFSVHLRVSLSSPLGSSLGVIQHMAGLAVIHGIRQQPGYQDLDLRLKWPNDIYFGQKMKLGGVLVQSSVIGNIVHINAGVGVNVSNRNPTVCINDLIEQLSRQTGTEIKPLSFEQVLGYAVSSLEQIVEAFQGGNTKSFFDLYYKYWLHGGSTVHVESLQQDVSITGIDEQGYLVVKLQDGSTSSLQPDGNSFDIMKNLIKIKTR